MTVYDRFALMVMIASLGGAIAAKLENDKDQFAVSAAAFMISSCVFVVLGLFE